MRVLAFCPSPLDGTAYWRVASPLSLLRKRASDFQFTVVDKVNTNLILEHDILLLQRPCDDFHVNAMQTAQILGRPVWCDWDDDVVGVPPNNPRVFLYQQEKVHKNVRMLAAAADAVTVTCSALARKFKSLGAKEPVIVPNALDPTLELLPADEDKLKVRRVAWRGGDSHNQDLLAMGRGMPNVAADFEGEILWHYIGFNPYWLLNSFPAESVRVHQWIGDVVTYFRFMSQLRPDILAVPLVEDSFNKCKSNISAIEAAWMGAVPVVPKWLEGCDLPGAFVYEKDGDFEAALRSACEASDAELADRLSKLREAVADKYSLDGANLLRALVMKRLTGKRTDTWAGKRDTMLTKEQRAELESTGDTLETARAQVAQ